MNEANPAQFLSGLTDLGAKLEASGEVASWCEVISAEIDRLQAEGERLREDAIRHPTRRRIAKANNFCAAVEPELRRAAAALRRIDALYRLEPPTAARH